MNPRRPARRPSRSAPARRPTTAHAVAVSGTPRYARLRAAAVRGAMVGELLRRTPDGRKVVLFRAAAAARKRNDGTGGRIAVGRRFFLAALKDYSDWRRTWWRESVQNSVDAGAKRVMLGVVEQADGTFRVWCQDDGTGMSREMLLGKFLVLGESGKEGVEGATGGFGKAKEMLLLPWLRWSVTTRGTRVEGAGDQYTVTDVSPPMAGTLVEVVMPADDHTNVYQATEFLSRCHTRGVSFATTHSDRHSGGEQVRSAPADLRVGKEVGELPGKAVAYYDKRGTTGIYIRVNGLFMFDHWTPSGFKGTLIIEVTGRSTEMLTSNRDGFRDVALRRWYEDLMAQIATDTQSALAKKGKIRKIYKGTGRFEVRVPKAVEADLTVATTDALKTSRPVPYAGGFVVSGETIQEVLTVIGQGGEAVSEGGDITVGSAPAGCAAAVLSGVPMLGPEHVERTVKQLAWTPDFYVINDVDDWKVPKAYLPESMSKKALRLAKAWTELVRLVFIKLNSDTEYGVGWVFSRDAAAMYLGEATLHWILLNPMVGAGSDDGRMLDPSNPADVRQLWASAIHEVTHCADRVSYHNESFASALTNNIAKCADAWPAAVGVVAAVLGGADVKLREALVPSGRGGRGRGERAPRSAPAKMVFQDRMVILDGTRVAEVKGGVDGSAGAPLRVVLTDLATGEEFGEIPLRSGSRAELERAIAAARSVSAEMGTPRGQRGHRMAERVRQEISADIADATGGKHLHPSVASALDTIRSILRSRAYDIGDMDVAALNKPRGHDVIDVLDSRGDVVENTVLSFDWHRFDTGRYEVVAYLS